MFCPFRAQAAEPYCLTDKCMSWERIDEEEGYCRLIDGGRAQDAVIQNLATIAQAIESNQ